MHEYIEGGKMEYGFYANHEFGATIILDFCSLSPGSNSGKV